MAEAIARKYLPTSFEVSSAGTRVPTEGPGKADTRLADIPVAEPVIRCLREIEGIDVSQSKNRQLTPEMLVGMDKIVVMAERETIPDFLKECCNSEYWEIKDPFQQPYEFFCETVEQIKAMILKLAPVNV